MNESLIYAIYLYRGECFNDTIYSLFPLLKTIMIASGVSKVGFNFTSHVSNLPMDLLFVIMFIPHYDAGTIVVVIIMNKVQFQ